MVELVLDGTLYTEEVIFRVCYWFTNRCYVFVERRGPQEILVRLSRRDGAVALPVIAGEFANELVNQRVRDGVARETRHVRELLVAQAFAEATLNQSSNASPPEG